MTKSKLSGACIAALVTVAAFPAHAMPDRAFVMDAMKGDNSEIALGRMAMQRSASPAVKAYGQMLVDDHGAHRMKLVALGRMMHVPPTMALPADGMMAKHRMMHLHGQAFDAAFRHHMVSDHEQDIDKYNHEVQSAKSPQLRQLAQDTLPTLRKHLDGAKAL